MLEIQLRYTILFTSTGKLPVLVVVTTSTLTLTLQKRLGYRVER